MSKLPPSTPELQPRSKGPRKRLFAYFGANSLAISILLHVLFGVGATFLIVEHFQKKHINFHATEPPAQHTDVEHKVELAKRNNVESAPPDIKRIVTTDVSAITLPEPPEVPQTQEVTPVDISGVEGEIGTAVEGAGQGAGGGAGGGAGMPAFGSADGTGLEGDFYDIKQTSAHKSTKMDAPKFEVVVDSYLKANWDESILHQYFRGHKPLYTTRFAISSRESEEAPKAFDLQNEVKPACWVVHYHGTVQAPDTGDYRFMGFGDDILIVKIAGTVVIDAGWFQHLPDPELHQTIPNRWSPRFYTRVSNSPPKDLLKMGKAFHMEAGQSVDMDVLIGDQGGLCAFYLMVMKADNAYQKLPDGTPLAPFFQLDTKGPPTFSPEEDHPPFSSTPEPWQTTGIGNATP